MTVFWNSKKAMPQADVIKKAEENGIRNWKERSIFSIINNLLAKGLIQAEGLKSTGDIVYHLMTGLLHLLGSRDIFLNAVKSQIPETFQESGYTIDSSVIPFCIQFRRSYEQLIHT